MVNAMRADGRVGGSINILTMLNSLETGVEKKHQNMEETENGQNDVSKICLVFTSSPAPLPYFLGGLSLSWNFFKPIHHPGSCLMTTNMSLSFVADAFFESINRLAHLIFVL